MLFLHDPGNRFNRDSEKLECLWLLTILVLSHEKFIRLPPIYIKYPLNFNHLKDEIIETYFKNEK